MWYYTFIWKYGEIMARIQDEAAQKRDMAASDYISWPSILCLYPLWSAGISHKICTWKYISNALRLISEIRYLNALTACFVATVLSSDYRQYTRMPVHSIRLTQRAMLQFGCRHTMSFGSQMGICMESAENVRSEMKYGLVLENKSN